ncbi:MAG: hypothetical protein Q9196_004549 [Gyalolechia fulgens]
MHSPVLINYDPAIELDDEPSDWDDYSTDFYDFDESETKRRKANKADEGVEGTFRKPNQRKMKSIGKPPDRSLGDPISSDEDVIQFPRPTVVWKRRSCSPKLPVLEPGQEEKVSILKDWRDRFKLPPSHREAQTPRHQRAVAVVIQQTPAHDHVANMGHTRTSISASTRKRLHEGALPSDSESSDPADRFATKPLDHRFKRTKRENSRPVEAPPEPILANAITSTTSKRKRQPNDANDDLFPPRKMRARRGTHDPPRADKPGVEEGNHDDGDGNSAPLERIANSTTGLNGSWHPNTMTARHTGKRKQPATQDRSAAKHDPKGMKSKPPGTEHEKENSRPKAASVGRRSTRGK